MGNRDFDYNYKLTFIAEWYDYQSCHELRSFRLSFYPCDDSLELYDIKFNKIYLRRVKCDGVTLKDIFVGNNIRVYGRQLYIDDYADCKTREFIGRSKDHTFAIIKPSAMDRLGDVLTHIEEQQFQIIRMRMCKLSRKETLDFYDAKKGDAFLPFTIEHIVSGYVVALEVVGNNAVERFNELLGPDNPIDARKTHPNSFRAIYGIDQAQNAIDASSSFEEAVAHACFFFPDGTEKRPPPATVRIENTTCCIIKPHAIAEGKLGSIITEISSKFQITALQMYYLTNPNVDEFLEVYKGVVTDFHSLLMSFLDGPCVALEVSGKGQMTDVHAEFRKFAGPTDSDIAKQIRPNTLRGIFGCDRYRNAVHCTDLPEDTKLELEYFFKILDS